MSREFLRGIVEGYYGRPWPTNTRRSYASYLAGAGLNTCLYAPKGDAYRRKRWPEHWPAERWRELLALSRTYREQRVFWGVGLSPFELYRNYGPGERRRLQEKLKRLAELEAPLLAILFDDMPGEMPSLAQRQSEIIADVVAWMPSVRVLVCPTYYSFDPVLEKHFGTMPAGYGQQLGRELPAGVDVFWTGNKVCSERVEATDIEAINKLLGRKVALWDNYPVNDGAVRSRFLYCEPLSGRDPALAQGLTGHLCNPMNQGLVSLPALLGLARLYDCAEVDDSWLAGVLGEATWRRLSGDRSLFQQQGLDGMGEARLAELATVYEQLPGEAAREVAGWLRGEYTFDPACLTD